MKARVKYPTIKGDDKKNTGKKNKEKEKNKEQEHEKTVTTANTGPVTNGDHQYSNGDACGVNEVSNHQEVHDEIPEEIEQPNEKILDTRQKGESESSCMLSMSPGEKEIQEILCIQYFKTERKKLAEKGVTYNFLGS